MDECQGLYDMIEAFEIRIDYLLGLIDTHQQAYQELKEKTQKYILENRDLKRENSYLKSKITLLNELNKTEDN